jgi:hypothetical protein
VRKYQCSCEFVKKCEADGLQCTMIAPWHLTNQMDSKEPEEAKCTFANWSDEQKRAGQRV